MNAKIFSLELSRFLRNKDPEVLCVTGKWGVGKTFAWNYYLQKAGTAQNIALDSYSYVSLFGQNSLHDVRYALFEQKVGKEHIGKKADFTTLEAAIQNVPSLVRKTVGLGRYFLPQTKDIAEISDRVGFFSVRRQLVCLDDLERRGAGLKTKDVLGLVAFLKEERDCKVVLLLNDDAIEGDEKADFERQLEKVADTVLQFEPTPIEAADIGVDKTTTFHTQLHANCVALGIVNIRVIKRIERHVRRLAEELSTYDPRVLQQAIHSSALFIYAKYLPGTAPSLAFIQAYNPYEGLIGKTSETPAGHAIWRALLSQYKFTNLDEFDEVLLQSVQLGHIDTDALKKAAEKQGRALKLQDENAAFHQAWDMFHHSFKDNTGEVLDAMEKAIRNCSQAISPMNLSSTIALLKKHGREANVPSLLEHYVQSRTENREFWDLSRSVWRHETKEPDVVAAFAKKLTETKPEEDLRSILIRIGTHHGWSPEDVTFLANVSVAEFYDLFKATEGGELRQAIYGALMFRDISNASEEMKSVTENAIAALKMIGEETPMNAVRVAKYIGSQAGQP